MEGNSWSGTPLSGYWVEQPGIGVESSGAIFCKSLWRHIKQAGNRIGEVGRGAKVVL